MDVDLAGVVSLNMSSWSYRGDTLPGGNGTTTSSNGAYSGRGNGTYTGYTYPSSASNGAYAGYGASSTYAGYTSPTNGAYAGNSGASGTYAGNSSTSGTYAGNSGASGTYAGNSGASGTYAGNSGANGTYAGNTNATSPSNGGYTSNGGASGTYSGYTNPSYPSNGGYTGNGGASGTYAGNTNSNSPSTGAYTGYTGRGGGASSSSAASGGSTYSPSSDGTYTGYTPTTNGGVSSNTGVQRRHSRAFGRRLWLGSRQDSTANANSTTAYTNTDQEFATEQGSTLAQKTSKSNTPTHRTSGCLHLSGYAKFSVGAEGSLLPFFSAGPSKPIHQQPFPHVLDVSPVCKKTWADTEGLAQKCFGGATPESQPATQMKRDLGDVIGGLLPFPPGDIKSLFCGPNAGDRGGLAGVIGGLVGGLHPPV